MGIRDLIFIPFFFLSLPVCFFRPFFGVLMWAFVSFVNPHRFVFGMAYWLPVSEMVAIPTIVGVLVFGREWRFLFTREVKLVMLLWVWFTFTTIFNTHQPEFAHFAADTWYRWKFVSKILLMALMTAAMITTWSRLRWLLLVVAGSLGVMVVKAIPFMILTAGSFRLYGPERTMLEDNNALGLALNMTLPMFFFLAQTETRPWVKRGMAVLFIATIPAILFTYSRGALLGLVAILFGMLMRLRQRMLLVPILVIVTLFAVFATPEKWRHRMDFRREGALIDDSAMSRFNSWTYSWRLAQDYPLTGAGFEAFTPRLFMQYAPNPLNVKGPHSIYFGVLAEHGFIGLFLYLTMLGGCFLTLRKLRKYGNECGNATAVAYASMFQFSFVGFMVTGAFLGFAYFDYFFTVVACVVGLTRLCKMEDSDYMADDFALEEQMA